MSHYAKVENGIVTQVIVAEQDVIDSGEFGDPSIWIQTSYNTRDGKHILGGTPLRKNYAAVGYSYDRDLDAFIPPKKFKHWILDADKCQWIPPKKAPDDTLPYHWDDEAIAWVPTQSPFPSWVVFNRMWVPPVDYPTDGKTYQWDEKKVSWVPFTPPIPEKPYPSWVFVDGHWTPPTPAPYPERGYDWNEYDQTWIPKLFKFKSWHRDPVTGHWTPPVPMPTDGTEENPYFWVESDQKWVPFLPK